MNTFWRVAGLITAIHAAALALFYSPACHWLGEVSLTKIEVAKTQHLTTDSISYGAFWMNNQEIVFLRSGTSTNVISAQKSGKIVRTEGLRLFTVSQTLCLMDTKALISELVHDIGRETAFGSSVPTSDEFGKKVFIFQGMSDSFFEDRMLSIDVDKRIRSRNLGVFVRGTMGRFAPYNGTVSPDGKKLALNLVSYDLGRGLGVYHAKTGELRRLLLPSNRWGSWNIAWSFDSRMVAFVTDTDTSSCDTIYKSTRPAYIEIVDVTTGQMWELPHPYRSCTYLSWSPRGDEVIAHGVDLARTTDASTPPHADQVIVGRLWRIPIDGSERTPLTDWGGNRCAWSPDGKMIAFEGKNAVWVMDENGGNLVKIADNAYLPRWSPDSRKIVYTQVDKVNWSYIWLAILDVEL